MRSHWPVRRSAFAAGCSWILLTGSAPAAAAPELPDAPTLQDFVRVAEARNPGLESARRNWQAESEAVRAAGSFPDPQLSVAWFAQEVETRVGPQKQRVSLRQRLPWFGKLGLSENVAREGAAAARARHGERRLELRRDVTLAWLDLYWLGRASTLTRENLDLLVHLETVIRERYRLGKAAHSDLIRMQVELGMGEERVRSLEDQRRPAVARMNALLRRPDDAPVPLPSDLPNWSTAPDPAEVLATVRAASPRLSEQDSRVAQAGAAQRLARRQRWPDWMVSADWIRTDDALNPTMADSGKDPVIVGLSVDLPIFRGKWDAPTRAAAERLAGALARRDWEEDRLVAEAQSLLFDWRDADRRVELYQGALLPKAQASYEALRNAYRTGEGGFLDLMDAQRMLLEFELERERAMIDRGRSAARLLPLTGTHEEEVPHE